MDHLAPDDDWAARAAVKAVTGDDTSLASFPRMINDSAGSGPETRYHACALASAPVVRNNKLSFVNLAPHSFHTGPSCDEL
jgi:hypothetical protein